MSAPNLKVELKLNGTWVDVSADLMGGYRCRRGIFGSGPNDLVAGPGEFQFALNNSTTNSAQTRGYYALTSPNKRTYFDLGIGVRATLTVNGSAKRIHTGTLDLAVPAASIWGSLDVRCTSVDWMALASDEQVTGIAVQTNKSESQLVQLLVTASAVQPDAVSLGTGQDSYAYALDSAQFQSTVVLTEMQRIAQAARCYIFMAGSGTLTLHTRSTRINVDTNADNFSDVTDLSDVTVAPSRASVLNRFLTTVHPRRVDAANTTVLLQFRNAIPLGVGVTYVVTGAFVDPTQQAARVGGTDMIDPVASTDYTMNSAADGSGTDLTSSLTVTATFGSNGAQFTFTNGSATPGFVTLLQCRGRGIYDFQTLTPIAEDVTSQTTYGKHEQQIDLIYQTDLLLAKNIGLYYLGLYKDPTSQVVGCIFSIPRSTAGGVLAARVLALEVSDKIGLTEQQTGISNTDPVSGKTVGHFVNGIDIQGDERDNLVITLTLAPASTALAWKLAVAGRSELGGGGANGTCLLGFGGLAA